MIELMIELLISQSCFQAPNPERDRDVLQILIDVESTVVRTNGRIMLNVLLPEKFPSNAYFPE